MKETKNIKVQDAKFAELKNEEVTPVEETEKKGVPIWVIVLGIVAGSIIAGVTGVTIFNVRKSDGTDEESENSDGTSAIVYDEPVAVE